MLCIPLHGGDWLFRGFLDEAWRREGAVAPDLSPDRRWNRGSVPGSVAHDLWQAGMLPDPYTSTNIATMEWVPARTWVYRKMFHVPEDLEGHRVTLTFEGLDYAAHVFLNGESLESHRSQFAPAQFNVSEKLAYGAPNILAVVLEPIPSLPSQHGRTSNAREHKTRMTYGWDFCPRLPHVGIWDEVYLHVTGPARIENLWVRPVLEEDLRNAKVLVTLELCSSRVLDVPIDLRISLRDEVVVSTTELHALPLGRSVVTLTLPVECPALWWPNGHGDQPLYEVEVHLRSSDARTVAFGMRSLRWTANETPDSSARPYTVVVNGRRVYLKGWNWVPTDLLYGVRQPNKLKRLLDLAKQAHVNLLRVGGMGIIERRAFYDLCDRHGIMIWQEFIQSSSSADRKPASDPVYLDLMRCEAEAIVPQKRNHPSLVIWCGGNELENLDFLPLDDDEPVLALLKETVQRLDPDRLWLPTSASGPMPYCGINTATHKPYTMHDVHGPWHHQGLIEQYTLFNRSHALLHSELGAEGLANLRTLEQSVPEPNRWPPAPDDRVWACQESSSWLRLDVWKQMYGEITDLPMLVRATQALQAEGVRYAIEANRRRKFENSGTLPWMFNEPYPQPAGTAAVDYYTRPKPLYYAVAKAYAPVSISARFASQVWAHEDAFKAEVWLSCTHGPVENALLKARLIGVNGYVHHLATETITIPENSSQQLSEVEALLGDVEPVFLLDLELTSVTGERLAANRYPFSRTNNLALFLTLPHVTLEGEVRPDGFHLVNTGNCTALFVWLEDTQPLAELPHVLLSDNHFCLLPGEARTIPTVVTGSSSEWRVSGWNTNQLVLKLPGAE